MNELIESIERQRDVYKQSVERLLGRLDPGKRMLEDSLLRDMQREEDAAAATSKKVVPRKSSLKKKEDTGLKTLREIQEGSKKVIREKEGSASTVTPERTYRPSPYRSTSSSSEERKEKELEARVRVLSAEIEALKEARMKDAGRLSAAKEENERLVAEMAKLRVQRSSENAKVKSRKNDTLYDCFYAKIFEG